ncbi:MAG TPA: hypothetical protein DCF68_16655 [Cyanothece sp. UBA12306]|nr:hypothetical protein [Cyanothece sp. UBA12306]
MELENYFEFLSEDDIRLKGTRVGIESILYEYIYKQRPPEEIIKHFSGITLEQTYATVLYYLHNKETVSKYIADWLEWGHQQRKKQQLSPHPAVARLQNLRQKKQQLNIKKANVS